MFRKINLFLLLVLLACSKDDPSSKGFALIGSITEKDVGVAGVSVSVNGQARATTDVSGQYRIENLAAGTYTVNPESSGATFFPTESTITITDLDAMLINFARVASDQVVHHERLWTLFRPSVYSIKQNTTELLQLDLLQNALWYQNSQGGLVYVEITGDFTITTRANAVRKSDNSQAVACNVCLGGIMVRNPSTTSGENYVHLVTGFTPNGLGVEYKSTTNSGSAYNTIPDGSSIHDLRIQRTGSSFTLYQKLPTQSVWNTVVTYTRTDLPSTVMAGINIYTAAGGAVADLSVIAENITIN